MNGKMRTATIFVLLVALATAAYAGPRANSSGPVLTAVEKYRRTELYFGLSKKDGAEVTEADWQKFLNDEVTPRFPDGFTVLEGVGQFRMATGVIVREHSRVLVLFYPKRSRREVSAKIDEIRAAYCRIFDQESVLRMDLEKSVNVKFGL
jgi:hypothetical protein